MSKAATWGYSRIIDILARAGADPDIASINGGTPLMVSVFFGYKDVVEYLLKLWVDVNARDIHDKTALYWARWSNHRAIAKLLRAFGATL